MIKLSEIEYCVATNVAGDQKPIKGSIRLEIPLDQIGNYLEFAGFFIALRNGLCDVAGHSKCKQIVIYRNRDCGFNTSLIDYYDLHAENISDHAIQCIYDEYDLERNINMIIDLLKIQDAQ